MRPISAEASRGETGCTFLHRKPVSVAELHWTQVWFRNNCPCDTDTVWEVVVNSVPDAWQVEPYLIQTDLKHLAQEAAFLDKCRENLHNKD